MRTRMVESPHRLPPGWMGVSSLIIGDAAMPPQHTDMKGRVQAYDGYNTALVLRSSSSLGSQK